MFAPFEYLGSWWTPTHPDRQASGTLRFVAEEGARLEVLGTFEDSEMHPGFPYYALIQGTSSEGKLVTLVGCQVTQVTHSAPVGIPRTTIDARYVLVGAHLKEDQLRFYGALVELEGFDEWTEFRSLAETGDMRTSWQLSYKRPEIVSVSYPEQGQRGIQVTIESSLTTSSSLARRSAREQVLTGLNVSMPLPLPGLLALFLAVQAFFEIACRAVLLPTSFRLFVLPRRTGNQNSVEVFEKQPKPGRRWDVTSLDMNFRYQDVAERLPTLLRSWIGQFQGVENVLELYRDIAYETGPDVFRFLLLVFALENYLRTNFQGKWMNEETFAQRLSQILEVLPAEERSQWKDNLKYLNEMTLRNRLKSLRSVLGTEAADFVGLTNGFVDKVVTTRNYYVHQATELKEDAFREEELRLPLEQLRYTLELLMMCKMGFGQEELPEFLARSRLARGLYRSLHGRDYAPPAQAPAGDGE